MIENDSELSELKTGQAKENIEKTFYSCNSKDGLDASELASEKERLNMVNQKLYT